MSRQDKNKPLPRMDSNHGTKIQNLVSYQLDDRAK